MNSRSAAHFFFLACFLLSGCNGPTRNLEPGLTAGAIYVGTPRVSGRERLINDRRAQEEWLQRQLGDVDTRSFGPNAKIDTRSLALTAAAFIAKSDPGAAVTRAQHAANAAIIQQQAVSVVAAEQLRTAAIDQTRTALAKGEIDADEALSRIQALGLSSSKLDPIDVDSNGSGSGANPKDLLSFLPGIFNYLSNGGDSMGDDPMSFVGAKSPVADFSASPLEIFRDKLALREEIRTELNENALDETHDLSGHTLYRLTFDATILPDNDTSAWAVISAALASPKSSPALHRAYGQYLERRFQSKLLERVTLINTALAACNQGSVHEQIKCAAQKSFTPPLASRIIRQTSSDYADNRSPQTSLGTLLGVDLAPVISKLSFSKGVSIYNPPSFNLNRSLTTPAQVLLRVLYEIFTQDFLNENLHCYYDLKFPNLESPDNTNYSVTVQRRRELNKTTPCDKYIAPDSSPSVEDVFGAHLAHLEKTRIYAVTPKEVVQRISDVSARRAASEFLAGLSALAGAGSIDTAIRNAHINDSFLQNVRRQPLVVGFSKAPLTQELDGRSSAEEALAFGWILGPTFAIINEGEKPAFRHVVRQQAVTAAIIVPAWWDSVTITTNAEWRREDGAPLKSAPKPVSAIYSVPLPGKMAALDGMLGDRSEQGMPEVDVLYTTRVRTKQPARLVIRGDNIWRATEVLLGGQRADKIRLLPDMRGVVAEFNPVELTFGADLTGGAADQIKISVATSDGFADVGTATVVDSAIQGMLRTARGFGKRLIANAAGRVVITPPLQGVGSIEFFGKGGGDGKFHAKLADTVSGLRIEKGGEVLTVAPLNPSSLPLQNGDAIDLYLIINSEGASPPEYVRLGERAIYYKTKEDAQVKIEWVGGEANNREVKLIFPANASDAYESLKSGAATIMPVIIFDGENNREIPMKQETCAVGKGSCVINLSYPDASMLTSTQSVSLGRGEFSLKVIVSGADAPGSAPDRLRGKK